ncbi:[acyl-carrier-protein] S-malonyltransferase [Weissella uvarum]|uniref:ACP S-malonyltransferase n=1 Tax=Weissella uvarum TaxID=1479233 RepID=UPI001960EF13|nr:ACP S-malonyltransferase [Weissella uvarum]MBM7617728.1 [acyl-carrier-protein] S-malonyltransferase [Weissella uvarum]MCM0595893.1 ACP S-malonyltransferase [Weissella uvarum]
MRIGLLLSGQGAQKAGMGRDLYDNNANYRATVDRASELMGCDFQKEILEDDAKLAQTQYAQVAIYTMSMGIYAALDDAVKAQVVGAVGLSLGEYTALTIAGALTFDQGFNILKDRGRFMQEASDEVESKMIVILDDDQAKILEQIEAAKLAGATLYPANFNTPKQLVIAGLGTDVDEFAQQLQDQGIRVVPLAVSGAFHTPFMQNAAEKLQARLAQESVQPLKVPVYSNTTSAAFEDVLATLNEQIVKPTHFAGALASMNEAGLDATIELGPDKTLTKFAKAIVPGEVKRYAVSDLESLEKVNAELSNNEE